MVSNIVNEQNLFVYGTLKRGHRLHGILEGQKYLGEYHTAPNFDILDYGDGIFPIVVEKKKGFKVKGELYEVDPATFRLTDSIEIGAGYKPLKISLIPDDIQATMYVYTDEINLEMSDSFIIVKDNMKEWKHGRLW